MREIDQQINHHDAQSSNHQGTQQIAFRVFDLRRDKRNIVPTTVGKHYEHHG